ncbi:MAG TPA: DUF2306 domain-containing protein [Rhodothermales bacterium]|nr:DUF2306 domain-containing protein [Rhodothermales bacterium]
MLNKDRFLWEYRFMNNRKRRMLFGSMLLVVLGYFSWLMLRITLSYIPIRDDAAFLMIKPDYIHITHWKIAFFIHVFTSMFALGAGFLQFSRAIMQKWKPLHRWVGRIYVWNILFVTGPASLVMAFYANGGWTSRLAFILLAVLWLFTTAQAWRSALSGAFKAHRSWMYRSYALTLSALTLRIWKWLIVALLAPPPMDVYRIVAWLGFIPNLILAEWLIRNNQIERTKNTKNPSENLINIE